LLLLNISIIFTEPHFGDHILLHVLLQIGIVCCNILTKLVTMDIKYRCG